MLRNEFANEDIGGKVKSHVLHGLATSLDATINV